MKQKFKNTQKGITLVALVITIIVLLILAMVSIKIVMDGGLISKVKDPKEAFFSGMIMGGILEYICSFFQEILFGTISWDYSNLFLNFNGRTCLLYCFYWGIIAVVYLKIVYPLFEKIEPLIYKKSIRILTVFCMIFMIFDITISCMAANRQKERHNNVPAKNQIDVFLDNKYPDEYLDRVYDNKKEIK